MESSGKEREGKSGSVHRLLSNRNVCRRVKYRKARIGRHGEAYMS